LRIADFKCGLKIASAYSRGNLFVKRSSVFYWLVGIVIAALAVGTAFYFDDVVRDFIAKHQNRPLHRFMENVSRFGDWPTHFALGLTLAAIAWWRGSKKLARIFLSMLIALALAGVVGRGIQIATARARPPVKTESVSHWSRFSSKYHSFPSGHVAASTAFFGVLFLLMWRIGFACMAIPILIGLSRVYIAAHYLSDVVCAAILGILCALVVVHFLLRSRPQEDGCNGN
jgi:membrane-associated phospholipid phosphatase